MYKYLVRVIYGLVFTPKEAWESLAIVKNKREELLNKYLFPIVGITAFTTFIGVLLFSVDFDVQQAFKQMVVRIATMIGSFFLGSYILSELFPFFRVKKNIALAQAIVGYSSALIYFLYMVIPLFSDFFFLWLFSFFSINIVSNAVPVYIEIEENFKVNFAVVTTAIVLLTPWITEIGLSFILK